jgi:hypothetical protein
VLARRSCLDELSRPQRRVLELRAGVGAAAPRSRRAVAKRLRITVRRVTRLERTGLRALRAACGAPASTTTTTTMRTIAEAAIAPPSSVAAPAAKRGGRRSGKPSGTSKPGPASTPGAKGGVAGRSATQLPARMEGAGPAIVIPIVLLLLGLAGFGVGRLTRPPPAATSAPAADWTTPPPGLSPPAPAGSPAAADPPPAGEDAMPPDFSSRRAPSRRH